MQRLADDLVRHVRAVEVARVDVVHAQCHGFAQHRNGLRAVPGRPEHAGTGQLHGAVAHAVHLAAGQFIRGGGFAVRHCDLLVGESMNDRSMGAFELSDNPI